MKKNYSILVPVTKDEKKIIENKAKKFGMSTATYLRFLALKVQLSSTFKVPINNIKI